MQKYSILLVLFVNMLLTGQVFEQSIESKIMEETKTVTVVLPQGYDFEENKTQKYPTLILLDGQYLLDPFFGTVKYGQYWEDMPGIIIVAINQDGNKRFDETEIGEGSFPTKKSAQFFEFIGVELYPFIESKYRTLPFRMIAGHDVTSGFLNYYLFKDQPLFNAYINLSPEYPDLMVNRLAEVFTRLKSPIFFYQASSNSDLDEIMADTKKLDSFAKEIKNENLRYHYDNFGDLSHYSLVPNAIPSALYFIFDGYQPISKSEYTKKLAVLEKGHTQYLVDKYTQLKKRFGFDIKPRLSDFKAIEAAILKNKAYGEFATLASYSEKVFPKTTLPVYQQGMYWEKTGELARAAKTYKSAFNYKEIGEYTKSYIMERADALMNKKDDPKTGDYEIPSIEEKPEETETKPLPTDIQTPKEGEVKKDLPKEVVPEKVEEKVEEIKTDTKDKTTPKKKKKK